MTLLTPIIHAQGAQLLGKRAEESRSYDTDDLQDGDHDDVVHGMQVMQGMVFVWGESGPQAAAEADAMPVPGLPDLEQTEAKPMRSKSEQPMKNFIKSYYRELPYGWEVLAENLQDPCKHPQSALQMLC